MSTEFEQSGELRPGLFPEETAEEAVARIVAQNPQKHGVPLAEREHRLVEQARRIAAETQAFFDAPDESVDAAAAEPDVSIVADPAPRQTVEPDAAAVFGAPDEQHTAELQQVMEDADALANQVAGLDAEAAAEASTNGGLGPYVLTRDAQSRCEHQWPEDPDEDTRCPLCQMTFADWVNS